MAYGFKLIRVEKNDRIAVATVDAPPITITTPAFYAELAQLSLDMEADQDIAVFILRNANPDFRLHPCVRANTNSRALIHLPPRR